MAKKHDSELWAGAYEAYKKQTPMPKGSPTWQKLNKKKATKVKLVRPAPKPFTESMILQQEYQSVLKQIKVLNKRRFEIKKMLKAQGKNPIMRSEYFDKPIWLYALRLQDNCYYVGMSRNIDRRYKSHLKGGTVWTSAHPPLEVIERRETGLVDDSAVARLENDMTFEYAMKFGKDYVRGGGYCQMKPRWPDVVLQNEL